MELYIDVTWPIEKEVFLLESTDLANELLSLGLRRDLVHHDSNRNRLYIRGLFGPANWMPDVDRYRMLRENSIASHDLNTHPVHVSTYPYIDLSPELYPMMATLVIILESPHRDEYGGSVTAPIAPARGYTGECIDDLLGAKLMSCNRLMQLLGSRLPIRVVIANPVPFQTSAYAIHRGRVEDAKKLRNEIWRKLWDLEDCNGSRVIQDDFCARMHRYRPIAIVNACTSDLRGRVRTLLRRAGYTSRLFHTNHPSDWRRRDIPVRVTE